MPGGIGCTSNMGDYKAKLRLQGQTDLGLSPSSLTVKPCDSDVLIYLKSLFLTTLICRMRLDWWEQQSLSQGITVRNKLDDNTKSLEENRVYSKNLINVSCYCLLFQDQEL